MRYSFLVAFFFFGLLSLQAQEMKAITFNIRFANENDGNNRWSLRQDDVIDFLKYEEADFVGMQEALISQINSLDSGLAAYRWIGVGRDAGDNKGEFSPIFYHAGRWELLQDSTFWLSETPGKPSKSWDAALPRICTYGLFKNRDSGAEVYVFNTHYDHIGEKARANSSKLIVDMVDKISGFENTILTGDFNAESSAEPIEVITDSPLSDAFETTELVYGPEGTYTGFNTEVIPDRRIDYIFVGPDFRPEKYAVESKLIGGRYLSDHFPVIVTIIPK